MSEPASSVKGIDHLIVMAPDLDRTERAWRDLGFALTPRGFHQTGGTANHLIMLDLTYVELLGLADPAAVSPYRRLIEEAPGAAGIAFRGVADETFDFWQARGLHPAAPTELARPVDVGGVSEQARFRLATLERSDNLPFILFCCQHLTPEFVWPADARPHPNGARSLQQLLVIVDGPDAQAQFERITGRTASRTAEGEATLAIGDSSISLLSEAAFERRFGPAAGPARRTRPALAGFVLASSSLEQARRYAQAAGWPTRATERGFAAHGAGDGVVIEWTP
ncbi:MAG TPA: VOC family protein [Steroidobacteraceae bacterium]|nr:VOC family protein [Steroidobacteraceae bacterium]